MKRSVYDKVIKTIESEEWDFEDVLKKLCEKFSDEKPETLRSILSLEHTNQVKRTHKIIESKRRQIFEQYTSAVKSSNYQQGVVLKIAKENRYSPMQIGKIVLEETLKENNIQGDQTIIKEQLKNTALIEDPKLSTEIWLANLKDNNYGVTSEWIKSSIGMIAKKTFNIFFFFILEPNCTIITSTFKFSFTGYEYEKKAKKELEKLGLSYHDEYELRSKGFDKTPDIKLDIPFAYKGLVINWIESKALFGDEQNHKKYLKDQLLTYYNRFGPGLVIYWFGFIEELDINREQGILICDHFPQKQDIEFWNPLKEFSTEDNSEAED